MKNELTVKNKEFEVSMSQNEVNELIEFASGKVKEISELSNKIEEARKAAQSANTEAKNAQTTAEEIKKITNSRKDTHWWNSKASAINDVKDDTKKIAQAQVDLANAQIVLAQAQQKSNEAQQKTFEFEEKLAKLTAVMVQVGTTSIARSNFLVRELEARMKGASEEELSEMARKELELVVCQIKGQQDVLSRQEQLTDIVREIDDKVAAQDQNDAIRDKVIEDQMQKGLERDLKISEQDRKNREQDIVILHESRKNVATYLALQLIIVVSTPQIKYRIPSPYLMYIFLINSIMPSAPIVSTNNISYLSRNYSKLLVEYQNILQLHLFSYLISEPPHSTTVNPVLSGACNSCGSISIGSSNAFHVIYTRIIVSGHGLIVSSARLAYSSS